MKSDQAEKLDVFLSQSKKVLIRNCDTEETDTLTFLKTDNGFPSPFNNKNTQR